MEIALLLLGLELVLVEPSEHIMEIITEEFSPEAARHAMVKSGHAKQTVEKFMNSTLSDKNIGLSISEDGLPSSLLTFRGSCSSIPKRDSLDNDEKCYNDMMAWRVLEVNESCRLGNNLIHDSMEVMHGIDKSSSWKRGRKPGISCCETPELESPVCQVVAGKQFPRCQYHSITSLKRVLTVLMNHSLMSWLVSGSEL
ncbi:probable ribonuclease 11 [Nannospalax galili]|uniref:probable ribonuclease 11 n=1 Tax=Nannospalax galili TaxID=1026970 RepID=UPI0004ED5A3F|nr:probable ribonuclease 11 [Nannospalax galili]XP_029419177.1 probable ribonuclease 11 [Nannospalax galili]